MKAVFRDRFLKPLATSVNLKITNKIDIDFRQIIYRIEKEDINTYNAKLY